MKRSNTYLLALVLILGLLLPLLRQTTSDFATLEEGVEYLGEKWLDDKLGILYDAAGKLKERLFLEDQPAPKTTADRLHHFFTYGFGYGLNSIGATEKLSRDIPFRIYNPSTLVGSSIVLITFFQFITLMIRRFNYLLPFLSLINVLLGIFIFGLSIKDPTMEIVPTGCLVFIGFHLLIMLTLERKIIPKTIG